MSPPNDPAPRAATTLVTNPTVYLVALALFVPIALAAYVQTRHLDWRMLGLSTAASLAGGVGLRGQSMARLALVLMAVYLACIIVIVIIESLSRPTTGWHAV